MPWWKITAREWVTKVYVVQAADVAAAEDLIAADLVSPIDEDSEGLASEHEVEGPFDSREDAL